MDHSVYGYLSRRTTEELEGILMDCFQKKYDKFTILQVLDVLEQRYLPGVFPSHIVQLRQELAEDE